MTRRRLTVLAALAVSLFLCDLWARDEPGLEQIGVHRVSGDIYRGRQPEPDAFPRMAELGVRTVVSLRRRSEAAEKERKAATAAGLRYIRIGLPRLGRPPEESIREILKVITAAGNQPVLVHCRRGADRTGVAVACYRIGREGWSADEALAEAKEYGLGWWQFGMKRFIRDSCGDAPNEREPSRSDG